jgi:Recombination endonuclease VII
VKRVFKTPKPYRDMTAEERRLWKNKLQRDYNTSEKGRQTRELYRQSGRLAVAFKRHDLKRYYGLTPEEWEVMFEQQGRKCAVCGAAEPGRKNGQWCTDHCHIKGRGHARGIVCNSCNLILGQANDSARRLQLAIRYLERVDDSNKARKIRRNAPGVERYTFAGGPGQLFPQLLPIQRCAHWLAATQAAAAFD